MWFKKNKWIIIAAAIVLAVLAAAYFLGGAPVSAPSQPPATASAAPSGPVSEALPSPSENPSTASPVPAETPAAQTAEPSASPRPADVPTPSQQPAPTPSEAPKSTGCTISISCAQILSNMDKCDAAKRELVPSDGWLLNPVTVTFNEGESVFNVLQRVCKQQKIHMEFENTPVYNSAYIEGIGNLYEFDVGELSGWMYRVNGWFPNYGCSQYKLKDGDTIEWVYTCDYGNDVGGGYASGGQKDE